MRPSGRGTVGDVPRTSDQSKALFAAASPVAVALSVAVGHCLPSVGSSEEFRHADEVPDGRRRRGLFNGLRRRATGRAKRRGSRHASFFILFLFSDKSCPTMAV